MDRNLLHISFESGILEDPWAEPPADMFKLSVSPEVAPDKPEYVELEFESGNCVAVRPTLPPVPVAPIVATVPPELVVSPELTVPPELTVLLPPCAPAPAPPGFELPQPSSSIQTDTQATSKDLDCIDSLSLERSGIALPVPRFGESAVFPPT